MPAAPAYALVEKPAPAGDTNDPVDNPLRLARAFLESFPAGQPLLCWRGDWFQYRAGAYCALSTDALRAKVVKFVGGEFARANREELATWEADMSGKKDKQPTTRPVSVSRTNDVVQALHGERLLAEDVELPSWIGGATGPDPAALLPVRNGLIDLEAAAAGRPGCLLPPTPNFFCTSAAPFDYDQAAPPPREWLAFLGSIWPDDVQSIDTLQEWLGYLLTPDTSQQKILFLLGPKRSGKGTIARVLRALLGSSNVAGPTLGTLAATFGLAPLLGKSAAIVPDARLGGRTDSSAITERLLSISGEDTLDIDRKHRDALTTKLGVRFVILANELPRLRDEAGALAGRLVMLRMTRSFSGHEDTSLFDRLRGELPGILNWAIVGWGRLRARGRFLQPASGGAIVAQMEDLSSPIGRFIREECVVGPEHRVPVADLYAMWRRHCEATGQRGLEGTEETFGANLRAAAAGVERGRRRDGGSRVYVYTGIRLRGPQDSDDELGTEPGTGARDGVGAVAGGGRSEDVASSVPGSVPRYLPAKAEVPS